MTTVEGEFITTVLPNLSLNDTRPESTGQVHEWLGVKLMLAFMYCTVFLLAVGGNVLVIYVVISNRSMQTVTNLFITNLAVSDVAVNCTSLWLTPLYTYLGRWVWGLALCYAMPLFQGTSIFISSFTLTAIAVDRYIVILYPFKARMSPRICLLVMLFIWTSSVFFVAPYAVNMHMMYDNSSNISLCLEQWLYPQTRVIYGVVVMTLQFGCPFVIIAFCYSMIWFHLKYRETSLGPRSEAELHRKRRMLKMLISMVVIYALCWIPPNVMNIVHDFYGPDITNSNYFVFIFILAHFVSMTATMWNPFLYAFMNDSFKREFRTVLGRWCCRKYSKNNNKFVQRKSAGSISRTETGKFTTVDDSRLNVKFSLLPPSENVSPEIKTKKLNNVHSEEETNNSKETELLVNHNSTDVNSLKFNNSNNSLEEHEYLL